MFNLSLHGSHNSTIAISKYDKILECVEFERLLSKKNAALFYYENTPNAYEYLKFVEKYFREKYEVTEYDNIIVNSVPEEFDLKSIFNYKNFHYMLHHEAHANSALYQSPYQEALIVSFDGGSDEGFFNIFHARRCRDLQKIYSGKKDYAISYMTPAHFIKDIKTEEDIYVGNLVYAGKLMGYVGFGEIRKDFVEKLKEYYHSNTYDNVIDAVDRFVSIFSEYGLDTWNSYFSEQDGKDIASSNQHVFEELFYDEIFPFLEKYPYVPLIISGGCGLNIINNTKLSKTREVFVTPNPSDVGLAIGMLSGFVRPKNQIDSTYIGPEVWDYMELPKYLTEKKYCKLNIEKIAKEIITGSIIGVVRGRSEHGPRALGNRSIIADATNSLMKDYINQKIKNRESFRPFSPVVRYEDVSKYFEWYKESRWMSFCPKVRPEYKELLSSVTHVDGTARVQTVTREQNKFLYDLLTCIDNIKGNAVILNTSFNIAGKPILNSYKEAFWVLDNKNLSGLILEDYFFEK
jgi:carbamoyltransferase